MSAHVIEVEADNGERYVFEEKDEGTFQVLKNDQRIASGNRSGGGAYNVKAEQLNELVNMLWDLMELLADYDMAKRG